MVKHETFMLLPTTFWHFKVPNVNICVYYIFEVRFMHEKICV